MSENSINKFKEQLEKYSDIWKSIEIRAILAFKEDQRIALKVRVYLRSAEKQAYESKVVFNDASLKVIIEYKKIEFLSEILDQVQEGIITVGDIQAKFGREEIDENIFYFNIGQARTNQPIEPDFPYFTLYASLGSVDQYVNENEINRSLSSYGYRGGLQELSNAKIGEPVGGSYVAYFGVVAPIPLLLDAEYESHYIKIRVQCTESVNPSDLLVHYELYGKTESELKQKDEVSFTLNDRKQIDNNFYLVKTIAVTEEFSSGRLTLFYKQLTPPVDAFNLYAKGVKSNIPNILNLLDGLSKIQKQGKKLESAFDNLIQWLGISGKAKDADLFEIAAWTLLTLSGLQTIHVGKFFGKGFDVPGIDLVAFHEQTKRIIIISCTIENKLSDKIESLLYTLNSIQTTMSGYNVKAVIFAPIDRKDVTLGSYSDAFESNITLVLKPEIDEILNIVKETSADSSDRVIDLIWPNNILPITGEYLLNSYRLWYQGYDKQNSII